MGSRNACPARFVTPRHRKSAGPQWSVKMGKALILWLLGVPGVIVIALLLFRVI
jgi:hypothetical protein